MPVLSYKVNRLFIYIGLNLNHRGPTHGVCVTYIRDVRGLPKGSKYPEKSRNKRKFALPGVFCLLCVDLVTANSSDLVSFAFAGYYTVRRKTSERKTLQIARICRYETHRRQNTPGKANLRLFRDFSGYFEPFGNPHMIHLL